MDLNRHSLPTVSNACIMSMSRHTVWQISIHGSKCTFLVICLDINKRLWGITSFIAFSLLSNTTPFQSRVPGDIKNGLGMWGDIFWHMHPPSPKRQYWELMDTKLTKSMILSGIMFMSQSSSWRLCAQWLKKFMTRLSPVVRNLNPIISASWYHPP